MKIRCIVASNDNGSKEQVVFTEDFEMDATDWFLSDVDVVIDEVLETEFPTIFPTEYVLTRE